MKLNEAYKSGKKWKKEIDPSTGKKTVKLNPNWDESKDKNKNKKQYGLLKLSSQEVDRLFTAFNVSEFESVLSKSQNDILFKKITGISIYTWESIRK